MVIVGARRSWLSTVMSLLALLLLALGTASVAKAQVPTPASVLGHTPGDDYYLADYEDSVKYFHALAKASDKIKMVSIGKTTQGRTFEYAIISNPENLAKFDQYVDASKKLADSRQLTPEQARELARNSKIIVHIDGGLHSSEVADHQHPMLLAYKLLSEPDDPEVKAILDNVVLLLWPTLNPDGMDMEVHWYRQQLAGRDLTGPVPTKAMDQRSPRLYQEYVGHDNNRDGYMLNMIESQVVTFEGMKNAPAIWYTQHQSAPFPARIWMPPFYDPISANIDSLMRVWTSNIGVNMMSRFEQEGKPGAILQATFDNWYPGYIDYIAEFRHTMAYFTETAHDSATPRNYSLSEFPKAWQELKPQVFYPSPWKGGIWRLRDSEDYMMTASMSTLETAVKYREELLYNRYLAGSRTMKRYVEAGLHAYVIPAGQADPQAAALLAQTVLQQGVEVYQNPSAANLGGASYPAGSWIIPMNQPFAGLVQELFERQKYPAVFLDKDGLPPKLPYDATGWTLPLQFGVDAVAIGSALPADVIASLQRVSVAKTPGGLQGSGSAYAISHGSNASFKVANAVLAKKGRVAFTDAGNDAGSMILSGVDAKTLGGILAEYGVTAIAATSGNQATPVRKARVGNYRPWGQDQAGTDAGWTQWVLEQYGFAPVTLHNADIRKGKLRSKVDVIVLPDTIGRGGQKPVARLVDGMFKPGTMPEEFVGGIDQAGVDALKAFVNDGGTLVAMNHSSVAIAELFDLPVENALAGLGESEFFCAGALFGVNLGEPSSATQGMRQSPSVMFLNSPAFQTKPGFKGTVLASYPSTGSSLQSGFAVHPERLQGLAAALEVEYGKGKVLLYGFAPQWRGQPQGTFKFLFNQFYRRG